MNATARVNDAALVLLRDQSATTIAAVRPTIERFPLHLLETMAAYGVQVVGLEGRRYADLSRYIADKCVDVDAWPVPPAGLFVQAEATLYLNSFSVMTIAHELSHAVDFALGNGQYLSGQDRRIRAAFESASMFVTPYAASGLDEYFAEAGRAMLEANDPASPWPAVSRKRLRTLDPTMFAIMARLWTPPVTSS